MSIITYPLNNIDYTAEDAELYNSTRVSGVWSAENNLDISIKGAREVEIGPGRAWIQNDVFAGKIIGVKSAERLSFDMPDSILDRIDRVVLRFDRAANKTTMAVLKGVVATSPVAPTITQAADIFELGLYAVSIPHGLVALSMAEITDTRLDEDVCGLMRDGVTGIPTAQLYAQTQAILQQVGTESQAFLEELEKALDTTLSTGLPPHAVTHRKGGSDEITPSSIGAASIGDDGKVIPSQLSSAIIDITGTALTLALSHAGKLLLVKGVEAATVTIPPESEVAFPVGTELEICRYTEADVSIAGGEGVTVNGEEAASNAIADEYSCVALKKVGADTWLLVGDKA